MTFSKLHSLLSTLYELKQTGRGYKKISSMFKREATTANIEELEALVSKLTKKENR